jgi:DNA polymerase III alpha subunit
MQGMGLQVLGPDVNESFVYCVNDNYAVRFGMGDQRWVELLQLL